MAYCKKCSHRLSKNAKFCHECGTKVKEKTENKLIRVLSRSSLWIFLLIIGTIIGYAISDTIDTIREKPNVTAVLEPLTKDELGLYYPINLMYLFSKNTFFLSSSA